MGRNKTDLSYQPSEGRSGRPRKLMVDGKLQCSTCREWKPIGDFYPAANTYYKVETRCKPCTQIRQRNFYNDDVEKYIHNLCKAHKSVARKVGGRVTPRRRQLHVESCLTTESVIDLWNRQGGKCAVTGLPMTHIRGKGHFVLTNISFDRIDSGLGYTLDNVRLTCKIVNIMKAAMSDSEMLTWCQAILDGPLNKPTQGRDSP